MMDACRDPRELRQFFPHLFGSIVKLSWLLAVTYCIYSNQLRKSLCETSFQLELGLKTYRNKAEMKESSITGADLGFHKGGSHQSSHTKIRTLMILMTYF